MKIPRCKGARDLMPQDMAAFRRIEEAFRTSCTAWGYKEIRTPVLEYLHLFTAAGTLSPSMLSRVYSFLDWDGWSGERVVLRPDGTIPAARLYVENLADSSLVRLFYTENMFSFEGTGQESRERWQCGVELIGGTEPEGDAELIMLALEILGKLAIAPVSVKLSHVGLLKTLLSELGLDEEEQDQRLKEILSGDAGLLKRMKGQPTEVRSFLKMLFELRGTSPGFLENLKSVLPQSLAAIGPCIDDLAQVAELLDSMGQEYEIDFATGEGFEYYTGMVFQFYSQETVLAKGGRYDELIPLVGGGRVPASGFALLLNRIMPLKKDEPLSSAQRILLRCQAKLNKGMKECYEIAGALRERGYVVEMDMGSICQEDCRWIISLQMRGRQPLFSLTDVNSGKVNEELTREQLLKVFRGAK